MTANTTRDEPDCSASGALDQLRLEDEDIDLQYAKPSSSAEEYAKEPWKHHRDLVGCYFSLRVNDRKRFHDKLTKNEKNRIQHETDRVKQLRLRFSSWDNKKELMKDLEESKTEWKREARKNHKIFQRQNRELQQDLDKQPKKVLGEYRYFIQDLQQLEQTVGPKDASFSKAKTDLVTKWKDPMRAKIQRDEKRIEHLRDWGGNASPSNGLPPGHSGPRKGNQSLLTKKSKGQKTQSQLARAAAPATDPTKPSEVKSEPERLYGIKACAMYFEKEVTSGTWVGYDHSNCRLKGGFPNQKILMDEILNEENDNPLMEPCPENKIRYFHFPTNNMSWVEVFIPDLRPRPGHPR